MDPALICRIVEAALLASNQPLTPAQLYELFPEDEPAPKGSIEAALETLREAGHGRGVELIEVGSGFRYQVCRDVHPWVARLWAERPTRYTRATLETLALIAYRQPITRGEIEQIRGVAVSSNIIRMLEEREWIRVIGHRDVPGRPALFGTTKLFLDYFNLKSLDELPPLSELRDLTELEPQLPLDGTQPQDAKPPASDTEAATTQTADGADTDTDTDAAPEAGSTDNTDAESDPESATEIQSDTTATALPPPDPALPDLENASDVIINDTVIHTAAVHLPAPNPTDSTDSNPQGALDDDAPEHIA